MELSICLFIFLIFVSFVTKLYFPELCSVRLNFGMHPCHMFEWPLSWQPDAVAYYICFKNKCATLSKYVCI
jgi:hypothetical protein